MYVCLCVKLPWSMSQDNCTSIQNQELDDYQTLQGMFTCVSYPSFLTR